MHISRHFEVLFQPRGQNFHQQEETRTKVWVNVVQFLPA
jgi:hypothetical protein